LVSDESNIISGLLVGLNSLDISIDLRSEVNNLDLPVKKNIDFSSSIAHKLNLVFVFYFLDKAYRLQ